MLGGLWEFPGSKIEKGEAPEMALLREISEECGLKIQVGKAVGSIKHTYSHISITLDLYQCVLHVSEKFMSKKSAQWIAPDQISTFPFPKANHKLFELLENQGWA